MPFLRQTWTLCEKTLTIVFLRHWLGTLTRALIAPVIFMFIISYSKNFFVPPSDFGIGTAAPLISFDDALQHSGGGRDTMVFINNGYTGGDISKIIDQISQPVKAHGMTAQVLTSNEDLQRICKGSVRGVTRCFGAVEFHSSPNEGSSAVWNYTIRADGVFGSEVFVNKHTNPAEIYILPLQHAIDNAIGSLNGPGLPNIVEEYAYTSQTAEERTKSINHAYMGSLIHILAVAYFVGIVGICYQLTGEMAKERELGMTQLIEAMMPNRRHSSKQAARLIAMHLAFDIIYLPSWIIMGAIVGGLNYTFSNIGIEIGYFIIAGLALSSWSVGFASLFKKAQLSGITVVMTSIVLAIIIQVVPPTSTASATVVSLLFPPMNFVLFIVYCAYWQQQGEAIDLRYGPPTAPWSTPGYLFFVFALIQIIAFPIIGALIERSLYGTASKARQLRYGDTNTQDAIKITGLSKFYYPNWFGRKVSPMFSKKSKPTVHAVDSLDVAVLRGQIAVLLGANGSGKTTTLDMLAGLQVPTQGTIEIDAAGGIGLCPQKNVLWEELTVYEHVRLFNKLKSDKVDAKATMQELIASCDIDQKMHAPTKTLSGGQKRKCQLAMMLTGGSKVCMLDEVSSGLDPLSRRKIWDILLAERGTRTILLTTHFLDEADLLSDDIAILSKGQLVANGSAVELKHRLGGGYRARIYHEDEKPLPSSLNSVSKRVYHDQTVYQLADSSASAAFIAELEKAGVRDYQVSGPTIEDVFLKLAAEVKEELEKDRPASPTSHEEQPKEEKSLQLVTGRALSFSQQTWVLFRKRATILQRNTWPYVSALLIPIIAAGLVTLFLTDFKKLSCSPKSGLYTPVSTSLEGFIALNTTIPLGPASKVPRNLLLRLFPLLRDSFQEVATLDDFNNFIATDFSNARPGGFFLGDNPTFAWRGNYNVSFSLAVQNLMDVSLLGVPIVTAYQPFDYPFTPSAGKSLQVILYFGLAMSAYPGFFALYTNAERLRNVRALHYSNGIRAAPLWIAYTLFDFIIVLLVSAIAIIIFTGVSDIWYGPGYLFVVFVFYGLSATLMSYVISLFATSQLAAFAVAAGMQCSMFLLYFIAYMCIITYSNTTEIDNNVNIAFFTIGLFFPAGNLLRAMLITFNEFSILCRGTSIASYPGAITLFGGPILYTILQSIFFATILVWWDSGWKPGFLARAKYRPDDSEEAEDVDSEVLNEAKRVDSDQDELRVLHVTKVFGSNVAVDDVTFGVPKGQVFALLGPNGAGKSTTIGLIRGDTRPSAKNGDILVENTSITRHRAAARANLGVCPQFDAIDQMTAIEHLRFYARARGVTDIEHNVDQILHAVGLEPFKSRLAGKLSGGNKRKLSLGIALMGNPSVLLLDEPSSGMDAASKRVMWRTLASVSAGRSLVLTTHSMEEADALADRAGIMARRMLALGTIDQLRKKHGDAHHVHLVHKDAPYTSEADMDAIKAFIHDTFRDARTEDRIFHGQLRFSVPNYKPASGTQQDQAKHETAVTSIIPENEGRRGHGISSLFAQLEANKERLGLEYYSVSQATLDQVFLSIITKHNVLEENYARENAKKDGMGTKIKRALGKETWGEVLTTF